jgi:ABC-type dipeptide/oligopeptide/nickel transport system permease subunit
MDRIGIILQIILIIGKLTGFLTFSWWWIFTPIYCVVVFWVIFMIVALCDVEFDGLDFTFDKRERW